MSYILANQSPNSPHLIFLAEIIDEKSDVWTRNAQFAKEFNSKEELEEAVKGRFDNGILGQLHILEKP